MDRQKLGDKMYMGKHLKGSTAKLHQKKTQFLAPLLQNSGEEPPSNQFHSVRDDSSYFGHPKGIEHFHGNALPHIGPEREGFMWIENRVSYNIDFKSKKEVSDFKAKLQSELMSVRNLLKRIERYDVVKVAEDTGAHVGRLKRVHSAVDYIEGSESRPLEPHTMPEGKNIGVATGNFGNRNVDVMVSEEKAPLSLQTKKSKANEKKNREELVSKFGMENSSSKVFKSCSLLLNKLMKSKVGWVFNKPVDVKSLGLHDYYTIIKHPMDLGTIRTRLDTKWYKAPKEFAEDVRLTFRNAMTYNMEEHDVNKFAKQLLKLFEGSWMKIEADYLRQSKAVNSKLDLPTQVLTSAPARSLLTTPPLPPISAHLSPPPSGPTDIAIKVDRSRAVTNTAGSEEKSTSAIASAKSRLSKPKAKDPHKREMTLEEKQKLSFDLQNLPSEKLVGVLRVIKKRNPSLCQNDDEIEVDIDTVDTETLWELDRFVINCKKSPSKMRSAELAPIDVMIEPILHEKNQVDYGINEGKENEAEENNNFSSSSCGREKEGGGNTSVSHGSSSSSSDSGSSSSVGLLIGMMVRQIREMLFTRFMHKEASLLYDIGDGDSRERRKIETATQGLERGESLCEIVEDKFEQHKHPKPRRMTNGQLVAALDTDDMTHGDLTQDMIIGMAKTLVP
ncbi:hypothetical protein V2J09_020915 [Rumex salicifolius]